MTFIGARTVYGWPKEDLEPVLKEEGINGPFMVEGTSYGTALAMATANYFGPERVSKLHLHVPYLPFESGQKGTEKLSLPDYQIYSQYFSGICYCMNTITCLLCLPCMKNPALNKKMTEKDAKLKNDKLLSDLILEDALRTTLYGALQNASVSHNTLWGFNPLDIEVRKVMVSYNTDDYDVPPGHGEFIGNHFEGKLGKENCKVNVDKGLGHLTQLVDLANGDHLRKLLSL